MGRPERAALIAALQAERKSTVICYLTSDRPNANGLLGRDAMTVFYEHLSRQDHERVDVLLFTLGGDTLAAFGLSRLVREFAGKISVLVPDRCWSAGTLFALGADEIVMSRLATLSPIDPSVQGPLNPAVDVGSGQRQLVPLSVESVAGFHDLACEDWGLKREDLRSAAFNALAERVHPLALGDVFRARQQIARLATSLLRSHRTDDAVDKIVTDLTRNFGSHDYMISRTEARDLLGKQVTAASSELEQIIWALYKDFSREMSLGEPYDPGVEIHAAGAAGATRGTTVRVVHKMAVVESATRSDIFEKEIAAKEVEMTFQVGVPPMKAIHQEVVRHGWKRYDGEP